MVVPSNRVGVLETRKLARSTCAGALGLLRALRILSRRAIVRQVVPPVTTMWGMTTFCLADLTS